MICCASISFRQITCYVMECTHIVFINSTNIIPWNTGLDALGSSTCCMSVTFSTAAIAIASKLFDQFDM